MRMLSNQRLCLGTLQYSSLYLQLMKVNECKIDEIQQISKLGSGPQFNNVGLLFSNIFVMSWHSWVFVEMHKI